MLQFLCLWEVIVVRTQQKGVGAPAEHIVITAAIENQQLDYLQGIMLFLYQLIYFTSAKKGVKQELSFCSCISSFILHKQNKVLDKNNFIDQG